MTSGRAIMIGVSVVLLVGAAVWFLLPNDLGEPTDGVEVAAPRPPNVLIVLWDTVRADRMSLYGHSVPTTPRIEAFAKDAAVFEHATAPGMWTLPTHASMFTGLYATTHGARAGYRWLDHRHQTLAEILGDGGYDTLALSANLVASPMTNVTQGFATVHTTFPRRGAPRGRYVQAAKRATHAKLLPNDASTELSPGFHGNDADKWGKSVHKDAAPVLHGALMEWLDERQDPARPWFAYVNMMEAHTPRVPSRSARERVMDAETLELGLKTDLSLFAENEFMIGKRAYTEAEMAAIRAVYDATLVDLDDATGALFDDLAGRGILEDTLVILVADHGEHLGEHQRFEHRWSVHEELLSVPLVIRYPAAVPAGRITDRVTTTDVFATVLDVVGLTAEGPHDSRSLLARTEADPAVFSQLLDPYASQLQNVQEVYEDVDYAPVLQTYCVAYEGSDKLIYASSGEHALYDLAADPHEDHNTHETDPDRAAELTERLAKWEAALATYDPSLRDENDGGKGQTRAEIEMLVALGYADEDEAAVSPRCGPANTEGTQP